MTMTWRSLTVATAVLCAAGCSTSALGVLNPSFESGGETPTDWRLSGGQGMRRTGDAADGTAYVTVSGTGRDMNYWRSSAAGFEPGKTYKVGFRARSLGMSSGTPVTGPVFCNVDLGATPEEWREHSFAFVAPDNLTPDSDWLRFGQWHVNGTVAFDDVRLTAVEPVYSAAPGRNGLRLGEGETLDGSRYVFQAPFAGVGRNHSRPLESTTAGFNTYRWVFGAGSEVVYRHSVGDRNQTAGALEVTVNYYSGGELAVDMSADGNEWTEVGARHELGTLSIPVPEHLLPSRTIRVRLRARARRAVGAAESDPGSFQINSYKYTATVDGPPVAHRGSTGYIELLERDPRLTVAIDSLGEGLPGGENIVHATVTNRTGTPVTACVRVALSQGHARFPFQTGAFRFEPGETRVAAPYSVPGTGAWELEMALVNGAAFQSRTDLFVPAFFDPSYGAQLPGSTESVGLWWASSGWKIPRTRALPEAHGAAVRISAAANEAEAAQFVVRPTAALRGLTARADDLVGPGGGRIPASAVDVLEVRYVPVTQTTDRTGVLADWPDPLPPLTGHIDIEAGTNQPFWVRVTVPPGTPAGTYDGAVRLTAEGWRADVPLQLTVFGFELPVRMTCQTAFGFSPNTVWRYQKIDDAVQRRAVLEKYWRNFSEHRISPYDPAPLDRFRVSWPNQGDWQGGTRDRETAAQGEASLKVQDNSETANVSARYAHTLDIPKNGFRLRFHYRTEPPQHAFIVTLNHHDAHGQWLSGRNNDMVIEGDPTWQTVDRVVSRFPPEARTVTLTLWATQYAEDGRHTGTVWYDALELVDLDTGEDVVKGGDFEPRADADFTPVIEWDDWDAAMTRAVETYGFNTVRFPVMGLGGGTFHARHEPSLLGYTEDTPEYRSAMQAYLGRVEAHLREKGWLDEAYVYWFDEPDVKDYEFVMNGFRKLKEWAPGLRRMLTEQVEEDLVGGPNLWCPVSPRFDLEAAQERRAAGDSFWWYVCTGPKAPYCTLFIDHPATEMRVWLWQTWKRRIEGVLVWQTNYWTSGAAYPDPDKPQNPYLDPMGWVSGYSTPKGTRRAWGNGDGRFIYPPVAAADANPEEPVLDGPVDSIRWEMLRDGIEDYEYFAILARLLETHRDSLPAAQHRELSALLDVPETVSRDMTDFTKDPQPLETHRERLAQAVEKLIGLDR